MQLAFPKTDFMPVHSLIRSKVAWAAFDCSGNAERVDLMILIGHKRKYPPIPLHFAVSVECSRMLPS